MGYLGSTLKLLASSLVKSATIGSILLLCLSGCLALSISLAIAVNGEDVSLARLTITTQRMFFVSTVGSDSGPGTADQPWGTLNHAAEIAVAGDTVIVRGGRYSLDAQVRTHSSGRPHAWITFIGSPGEEAVFDAEKIRLPPFVKGVLNNGAFQIEGVSYVRVANLTVINSHDAGITVRDSSDVELINNTIRGTFSSGIALWDTNHDDEGTARIRVIGNTISRATTWDLAPPDVPRQGEPPHEALSVGGAVDFEVAYNQVLDSDKEGIVIKETSKRGKVHHNLVEGLARQGIYIGSNFGELSDVEIFSNVIHHCRGAGFAISVEHGGPTERVDFHNNLVFNNDGSGIYFSRWGVENMRRNILISHNIFYHNGYGSPSTGQTYSWWTGGLYLYSAKVQDISISDNIFSENRGFQIGYSELFLRNSRSWQAAAREQGILIAHNLIFSRETTIYPIESGGAPFDRVKIYAVDGIRPVFGDPLFNDPAAQEFTLRKNSPATRAHIFAGPTPPKGSSQSWWKVKFPPKLIHYTPDGLK
jgi:parallel beta-helix repeat protein